MWAYFLVTCLTVSATVEEGNSSIAGLIHSGNNPPNVLHKEGLEVRGRVSGKILLIAVPKFILQSEDGKE